MQRFGSKARMAATILGLTCGTILFASQPASQPASQADRDFVGKVSQGGLYEVEAGKVAAMRGTTPFVKNFGVMESHDHMGVNSGLKQIAGETGVTITPGLNPDFSQRLAKLKAVPANEFDAFFINDMK